MAHPRDARLKRRDARSCPGSSTRMSISSRRSSRDSSRAASRRSAILGTRSTDREHAADRDVVDDFTSARAAVRQHVESGAELIAIGPRLTPPILAIVVQESAARGVPVAADLGLTTAIEAASFGVTSVEHLSGIVEAAAALSGHAPRFRDDPKSRGLLRNAIGPQFHRKAWRESPMRCWIAGSHSCRRWCGRDRLPRRRRRSRGTASSRRPAALRS